MAGQLSLLNDFPSKKNAMNFAGEYEGAAAPFMWDQMPRNALRRKACGERSEDFCAAGRHKSNGIIEAVEKAFSTALKLSHQHGGTAFITLI